MTTAPAVLCAEKEAAIRQSFSRQGLLQTLGVESVRLAFLTSSGALNDTLRSDAAATPHPNPPPQAGEGWGGEAQSQPAGSISVTG